MVEEALAPGDRVRLVGMPGDSEMNGSVGAVVKSIGTGRFAVMLDGKDKTTVISRRNLERCSETASAKALSYSIVGTWDDWEPHEMTWLPGSRCFEYLMTLGDDGVESFKFLVDGDWDKCIYPDRTGAHLHDNHTICGPDDGGLEAEWTVGLHQTDQTSPGSRVRVRVFLAGDDAPRKVQWESCQESQQKDEPNSRKEKGGRRLSFQDTLGSEVVGRETTREPPAQQPLLSEVSDHENLFPNQGLNKQVRHSGQTWPDDHRAQDRQVQDAEREARERLSRRLAAAAEAETKMITDGETDNNDPTERAELDKVVISAKLAENRRRYMAQCGPQEEANKACWSASFDDIQNGTALKLAEAAGQSKGSVTPLPSTFNKNAAAAPTMGAFRQQGNCMECSALTDNVLDVGGFCCVKCFEGFQAAVTEGWNGAVLIGGKQAAQLAKKLVDEGKGECTIRMARREIMKQHSYAFKNFSKGF